MPAQESNGKPPRSPNLYGQTLGASPLTVAQHGTEVAANYAPFPPAATNYPPPAYVPFVSPPTECPLPHPPTGGRNPHGAPFAQGLAAPPVTPVTPVPAYYQHNASVMRPPMANGDQYVPSLFCQQNLHPQVPGPGMHMVPFTRGPPPRAPPLMVQPAGSMSPCSPVGSPFLSTDRSGSCYSGGTRSAIISPSETSSISSGHSAPSRVYKCHVCQQKFQNGVQLHAHLKAEKHYKYQLTYPYEPQGTSSTELSGSTDSVYNVYYCSVCNVMVNSEAQLQIHNIGQKHTLRMSLQQRVQHSRSSSTSSEPTAEMPADSGYVSGGGDESLVVVAATAAYPATRFRCRACGVYLNSPLQAQHHLTSQKHLQRVHRPPFRRRPSAIFRRKQADEQEQPEDVGDSEPASPSRSDELSGPETPPPSEQKNAPQTETPATHCSTA